MHLDAGLKLCDHNVDTLAIGMRVRVNRSGDPHNSFMIAIVRKIEPTVVHIEIEGIATFAGMVNMTEAPFSEMVTKTAKFIEV